MPLMRWCIRCRWMGTLQVPRIKIRFGKSVGLIKVQNRQHTPIGNPRRTIFAWIKPNLDLFMLRPLCPSNHWNDYLWIAPVAGVLHGLSQRALPIVPKIIGASNGRGCTHLRILTHALIEKYPQVLKRTLVPGSLPDLTPQLTMLGFTDESHRGQGVLCPQIIKIPQHPENLRICIQSCVEIPWEV